MKTIAFIFLAALVFSGCSSRQYYEPEDTLGDFETTKHIIGYDMIDINPNGATLEDKQFISKQGYDGVILPENYKFLNIEDDTILAADDNKTILLKDNEKEIYLTFENNIISASKKGYLLALGFDNNSIMLYDTLTDSIKYKEYFKHSYLNDIKISSAVILDGVVLFPTLDGKVVIIDSNKFETIQTINIDPKSDINNIIYLANKNENLIAATSNKVFVFSNNKTYTQTLNVKFVTASEDAVYVSTLEGEVIKYNMKLEKQNSKKFRFAKFHALILGEENLYALESQEYLIKFDTDLENIEIFDFDFDEDKKVISIENKLYFDDAYIELK